MGRIPPETLRKAARLKAPLAVSRTSPTGLSCQVAKRLGIILIGYVRRDSYNVYSSRNIPPSRRRRWPDAPETAPLSAMAKEGFRLGGFPRIKANNYPLNGFVGLFFRLRGSDSLPRGGMLIRQAAFSFSLRPIETNESILASSEAYLRFSSRNRPFPRYLRLCRRIPRRKAFRFRPNGSFFDKADASGWDESIRELDLKKDDSVL